MSTFNPNTLLGQVYKIPGQYLSSPAGVPLLAHPIAYTLVGYNSYEENFNESSLVNVLSQNRNGGFDISEVMYGALRPYNAPSDGPNVNVPASLLTEGLK